MIPTHTMQKNYNYFLLDIAILFGSVPAWMEVPLYHLQDFLFQAIKALFITGLTYWFGQYLKKKKP